MAANSNNTNFFSSAGNDPFDLSWLFQSNDSNAGLNHASSSSGFGLNNNDLSLGHGQLGMVTSVMTEVRRTYVSPRYGHQSASFPLPDGTLTHEVVKTTRFFAPPSTIDRMFASNFGVGNQRSTLPTNVGVRIQEQGQAATVSDFQPNSGVFNQEQPARGQPMEPNMFNSIAGVINHGSLPANSFCIQGHGQTTAVSSFQPNSSVRYQGGTFPNNTVFINQEQPASVSQLAEQSQSIVTNQPHQALNILKNANKSSSNAHEVIDVDAYDSEVHGNSSRASENQPHWPNQRNNLQRMLRPLTTLLKPLRRDKGETKQGLGKGSLALA
ncbi:hypothetical protein COLO4_07142 [Corchorus olitorius]|uniref:Uncharacterized protein n=1 Tax=Corchorus olitorius TaxID=93759 RepID=A0A1R3KKV6_9ROSI|nr:hypothetical protein COLO4_07142 [Corchorus olitorius]